MGVHIKRNLAERSRKIALEKGIPIVTVETIIKAYLEDLVTSAVNGERIVIDGITSISIIKDGETGEYYSRGRVSPALKSKLQRLSTEKETILQ